MMLKIDKKGNILRPDGSVLGSPKKTGGVYRSNNRTGRIDLETGNVFDLKESVIGKVNLSKFEILADTIKKNAEKKEKAKAKAAKKSKKSSKVSKVHKIEETPTISIPKKEDKKNEYRPGLDSALLVSGQFSKMFYKDALSQMDTETRTLYELNKKYGWNYKNWEELSEKQKNLPDEFLVKYETYIDWYGFLDNNPDREFNEKYKKLFKNYLVLRNLGLVPYNGKREVVDNSSYKDEISAKKKTKLNRAKKLAKYKEEHRDVQSNG